MIQIKDLNLSAETHHGDASDLANSLPERLCQKEAAEVMGGVIGAGASLVTNSWISYSNGTPFNWQTSLGSAAIAGGAAAIRGGLWGAKLAG
jgi:hypothetical protein